MLLFLLLRQCMCGVGFDFFTWALYTSAIVGSCVHNLFTWGWLSNKWWAIARETTKKALNYSQHFLFLWHDHVSFGSRLSFDLVTSTLFQLLRVHLDFTSMEGIRDDAIQIPLGFLHASLYLNLLITFLFHHSMQVTISSRINFTL